MNAELEYWKPMAPSSFEKQELGKVWADAGLPWLGWQNGIPMFEGDPDWEAVRELAENWRRGESDPPASSESESPQFVPEKKVKQPRKPRKSRKGGA